MARYPRRMLRTLHVALCALVSLWAVNTIAAGKNANIAPPAFSVGGEWASYNKTPDGQRYSPLRLRNR